MVDPFKVSLWYCTSACLIYVVFLMIVILFTFYLQAHAASAILNFSENCTPDILLPYLDGIVSKLLVLLQVLHRCLVCSFFWFSIILWNCCVLSVFANMLS